GSDGNRTYIRFSTEIRTRNREIFRTSTSRKRERRTPGSLRTSDVRREILVSVTHASGSPCSLPLEMPFEELGDEPPVFVVLECRAAVTGARDHDEPDLDARFLESVDEDLALRRDHRLVLVAVQDEEWGGALRDVRDGIGLRDLFLLLE